MVFEKRTHHHKTIILKPEEHPIVEKLLDPEVVWILERLHAAGYTAYIVGGGVRDLLLRKQPKDFDISTSATPAEVTQLFYNSRIIGRRFRLVHVFFRDGNIIEVSTFRAKPKHENKRGKISPLASDNRWGSPKEDALRRDITINGLFYSHQTGEIIDHVGGLLDLRQECVRTIGKPSIRFQEDPVRMLRTIRHAARNDFQIEEETWKAIKSQAQLLRLSSSNRVRDEFQRELLHGSSTLSFELMQDSGLLRSLSPKLYKWISQRQTQPFKQFQRLGPYCSTEWGKPQALWENLSSLDLWCRTEQKASEILALSALLVAPLWSHVFQRVRAGSRTASIWQSSYREGIEPIIKELNLLRQQKESLFRIFNVYWRLHLYPHQNKLSSSINRSSHKKEAIQLFQIELQSHQIAEPKWLQQFM